jgi:hypothetical protein
VATHIDAESCDLTSDHSASCHGNVNANSSDLDFLQRTDSRLSHSLDLFGL